MRSGASGHKRPECDQRTSVSNAMKVMCRNRTLHEMLIGGELIVLYSLPKGLTSPKPDCRTYPTNIYRNYVASLVMLRVSVVFFFFI